MAEVLEQVEEVEARGLRELEQLADPTQIERWRVEFLGKKGALTNILRSLGALPPDQRPLVGQRANEAKARLENAANGKKDLLVLVTVQRNLQLERVDVTLPGRPPRLGSTHPTNRILTEIVETFVAMGFQVAEGPEVEWDRYNFEALNIPPEHPARDMWSTFYVASEEHPGKMLLRTHTSPNQIRVMEKTRPPVRVIIPGKCYRYEAVDASHEAMFYQVEGLAVDTGITMADLKGVLTGFAHSVFGPDRKVRFRCDYFPFVEPGMEMAIDCGVCRGAGCRLCGSSGWLEIMGAGMVHPKVLAGVGYDPNVYTGFAFGMGVERLAMLKYGIEDIRLFYGNDLRFLRQLA